MTTTALLTNLLSPQGYAQRNIIQNMIMMRYYQLGFVCRRLESTYVKMNSHTYHSSWTQFFFGVARGYGYISISDETTQHASLIPAINNGLTYL